MAKLRRRWRDERGMTLIMVGMGFLAFMSATMLAVDIGMLMVARTQAQKSADAGALAGAVALVFDDFNDRSDTGPAKQSAISAATSNVNDVINSQVSVIPADVTFPAIEKVRVVVNRTSERGNPVLTFIAPMIGIDSVDVGAVAVAEVVPANAATCIKPWAVPDKWIEVQTPAWDPDDEINMYCEKGPCKGQPLANPDIYRDIDQGDAYTGYKPSPTGPDYGRQVMLKAGSPNQAINSSHYFPIALVGGNGASWYEENIFGCWDGVATIGNLVPTEPGNMTGPTTSGVQQLIDKDPGARWVNGEIENAAMTPSPRIVVLPVFDPNVYEESRQHGRQDMKIANFVGFFIEDVKAGSVLGRMVPALGLVRPTGGPISPNAYLKAIRLVE